MEIIMEPMSAFILLGIGILLLGLEIIFMSFVLFWFGLGFIIVGFLQFIFPFSDGFYQLACVSVISVVLLFIFRNKMKKIFFKSDKSVKDNFLNEMGDGKVVNGMISFKGTLWKYKPHIKLEEGQIVEVIEAKNNVVIIRLKQE